VPDIRKKAEGRGLEKEEEDYFNEDRYSVFSFVIGCFILFAL
jgi:protein phosphatase-4 regulatory subunit 3